MLEDPDGGAGQASAQHQRGVVQLVAQDEATLKQNTKVDFSFIAQFQEGRLQSRSSSAELCLHNQNRPGTLTMLASDFITQTDGLTDVSAINLPSV